MKLDYQKEEEEILNEVTSPPPFSSRILGILTENAQGQTLYFLLLGLASISLLMIASYAPLKTLLPVSIFGLSLFISGVVFSAKHIFQGLETATMHLREASSIFNKIEPAPESETLFKSGIPALDSLYKVTESALSIPEQELLQIRDRLDLVLNNIAAAIILYEEEAQSTFCSSYIQVLTGYTAQELKNDAPEDLFKSIILESDWEGYRRARLISHLGEDQTVRFRIRHRSGLILWLESRMVPVINLSGDVSSVMSIIIDVTDTVTRQKKIEAQNQDLNDFAYMVSHDLKAPIFTIQGMADVISADYGNSLGKEGLELLNYITDAAKRLDKLVASVLEYSALSNSDGSYEEVSLNESFLQVIADLGENIKKSQAKIIIHDNLPSVRGEPIRIYQLLSNMLGNAIKYRNPERPLEINIGFSIESANFMALKISDNGLGIPENKFEDIFRPYRRAHGNSVEGSGIGLACVKKILDKLGGRIEVESKEGEGSSFTLMLPLFKPAPRQIPKDLERLF
ncbi:MAG TPA: ATP-binding protein [Oligoflexia bacterium]|nr:ATP-binding protein [Oligoflexia bacterium]HMP48736.1 ATP-binding protein [Oligoflexia bacterium]